MKTAMEGGIPLLMIDFPPPIAGRQQLAERRGSVAPIGKR